MLAQPMSEQEPNVVTAIGGGWTVQVEGIEVPVGHRVLLDRVVALITNADVISYNWMSRRAKLRGETSWITLNELHTRAGVTVLEIPWSDTQWPLNGVQVIGCVPGTTAQAQSLWGEHVTIRANCA